MVEGSVLAAAREDSRRVELPVVGSHSDDEGTLGVQRVKDRAVVVAWDRGEATDRQGRLRELGLVAFARLAKLGRVWIVLLEREASVLRHPVQRQLCGGTVAASRAAAAA